MNPKISRRGFLKHSGALGGVSAMGIPMALNLAAIGEAAASTDPSDYKALVCVFLSGGNDAYNMVPFTSDSPSWARYVEARTSSGEGGADVKLPQGEILSLGLTSGPAMVGLHPMLGGLRSMFEAGRLAIVGNVGPLTEPVQYSNYVNRSVSLPPKLYSHNDQTSVWQTGAPEGYRSGWGAAAALQAASGNQVDGAPQHLFTSITIESTASFSSTISNPGIVAFGASQRTGALEPGGQYPATGPRRLYDTAVDLNTMLRPVLNGLKGISDGQGGAAGHLIESDYLVKSRNAVLAWDKMSESFGSVSMPAYASSSNNSLASQLYMVAKIIKARTSAPLNIKRQVFFVQIGSFDTHNNQLPLHSSLMFRLNQALSYFQDLLGDDINRVTTFTASEFGRKLSQNNTGTDHGWGGHHFVMGGSQVAGGQVYGHFPDLSSWDGSKYGDPQLLGDGTMIPKVSVDQFGYQLAKWFGVPDNKLPGIFPNYWTPEAGINLSFMA